MDFIPVAFTASSVLTTILCFQLTDKALPRILFYAQSLIASICFIVIVVPGEYRPIAFSLLHFGHIYFHIRTKSIKFYEYSYLTLGISVLSFLYQTDFLSSKILWDTKGILLIAGYAGLFVAQTIFIFAKISESRDRYLYYILNFLIVFWAIYSAATIEYAILLFSV